MIIEDRLKKLYKSNIKILKREKESITLICEEGHTFKLNNKRIYDKKTKVCPECRKIKLIEEKREEIRDLCNKKESILMSEFNEMHDRLVIKHSCGHIYEVSLTNFRKRMCPNCSKKGNPTSFDDFALELGNDYEIISSRSEYETSFSKLKVVHKTCGKEQYKSLDAIRKGNGCLFCSHKSFKNDEEYISNYIKENKIPIKYSDKNSYKNNKTPLLFNCIFCNSQIRIPWTSVLDKRTSSFCKCQKIKISNPEKEISNLLESNGLKYIREKRFKDCKDTRPLPFDFYLEDFNTIIEYDGIHHFSPIYGVSKLEVTKRHDSIKDNFCLDKGITLYRIDYNDNINDCINKIVQRLFLGDEISQQK